MRIRVSNPKTKEYITFYDNADYNVYIGQPNEINQKNSNLDGNYAAISFQGLKSLPVNNNINYSGVNQDGVTFLSNSYENRQLIINFYGYDMYMMSQVLFQEDFELQVDVLTELASYRTNGHVIGRYEGGSLEISCHPFFSIDKNMIHELNIKLNYTGSKFLPLTMPRIWFYSAESNKKLSFDVGLYGLPTITLKGVFVGLTITNELLNQYMTLPNVAVNDSLIIDTETETIIADGVDVSNSLRGYFIELGNGKNTLIFDFVDQFTDVKVKVEYKEVTAYAR